MTKRAERPDAPAHRPRFGRPAAHCLDPYLEKWDLVVDGEPILTASSRLLPVQVAGTAAMLKMSADPQEQVGGALMGW